MTTIGVDVGGTHVRIARFEATPAGVAMRDLPTVAPTAVPAGTAGGPALGARLADLLADVVADDPRPDGIGLGLPGHVDHRAGTVRHAVNLGIGTDPHPLAADLSARLAVPVTIENDARTAALGALALLRPAHPDLADLVHVNLGTGVSAGIVVAGRLHRGRHGVAGEIGHAPLGDDTTACGCGLVGCLEAVVGGAALAARLGPGARTLFATSSSHPAEAARVARAVARALLVLATTHDPDVVVLGGGVADEAADAVRTAVDDLTTRSPLARSALSSDRVLTLPPGAEPGLVGAALLVDRAASVTGPTRRAAAAATPTGDTP